MSTFTNNQRKLLLRWAQERQNTKRFHEETQLFCTILYISGLAGVSLEPYKRDRHHRSQHCVYQDGNALVEPNKNGIGARPLYYRFLFVGIWMISEFLVLFNTPCVFMWMNFICSTAFDFRNVIPLAVLSLLPLVGWFVIDFLEQVGSYTSLHILEHLLPLEPLMNGKAAVPAMNGWVGRPGLEQPRQTRNLHGLKEIGSEKVIFLS